MYLCLSANQDYGIPDKRPQQRSQPKHTPLVEHTKRKNKQETNKQHDQLVQRFGGGSDTEKSGGARHPVRTYIRPYEAHRNGSNTKHDRKTRYLLRRKVLLCPHP